MLRPERTQNASVKHPVLDDIRGNAAKVADQRQRSNSLGVPEKMNFLQPHGRHPGSRTDDED